MECDGILEAAFVHDPQLEARLAEALVALQRDLRGPGEVVLGEQAAVDEGLSQAFRLHGRVSVDDVTPSNANALLLVGLDQGERAGATPHVELAQQVGHDSLGQLPRHGVALVGGAIGLLTVCAGKTRPPCREGSVREAAAGLSP